MLTFSADVAQALAAGALPGAVVTVAIGVGVPVAGGALAAGALPVAGTDPAAGALPGAGTLPQADRASAAVTTALALGICFIHSTAARLL